MARKPKFRSGVAVAAQHRHAGPMKNKLDKRAEENKNPDFDEEEELEEEEEFWNNIPKEDRPRIQFEYVVCLYGQGDCGFSLICQEDWDVVLAASDPCAGTAKLRNSRVAYFTDVADLVNFCQDNKINLIDSCHGYVY